MSYFQFVDTPASPNHETATEALNIFKYQQSPFEPEEMTTALTEGYFGAITKEDIHSIEILTSVEQDSRWILLMKYTVGDGFPYHAIVEVRMNNNGTKKKLLFAAAEDFSGYGHWYDVKHGIGFGSGVEVIEKVRVQTEHNQYTSFLHNGFFIYVSEEKPENITFNSEKDTVLHAMETFNFDEVYPLLAERKGEYSLFIVDSSGTDWIKILREKETMIANTIQTTKSIENARKGYPFLDLLKSPAFMVFDYNEMIFQTYDRETFLAFLEDLKKDF